MGFIGSTLIIVPCFGGVGGGGGGGGCDMRSHLLPTFLLPGGQGTHFPCQSTLLGPHATGAGGGAGAGIGLSMQLGQLPIMPFCAQVGLEAGLDLRLQLGQLPIMPFCAQVGLGAGLGLRLQLGQLPIMPFCAQVGLGCGGCGDAGGGGGSEGADTSGGGGGVAATMGIVKSAESLAGLASPFPWGHTRRTECVSCLCRKLRGMASASWNCANAPGVNLAGLPRQVYRPPPVVRQVQPR
jgi:hypothetical protein